MQALPVWIFAALIFCLRIVDVSLGTIRTITVVNGMMRLAVLLGFFEILVWVTAISQLLFRIRENPLLVVAYAAGFAAGNGVGIALERRLALRQCIVRMITGSEKAILEVAGQFGQVLGAYRSDLPEDGKSLVFVTVARRDLRFMLERAKALDQDIFWVVERFSEAHFLSPVPHATGWRAVPKKK